MKSLVMLCCFAPALIHAQTVTTVRPIPSGGTVTTTKRVPDTDTAARVQDATQTSLIAGIFLYQRHAQVITTHREQMNEIEGRFNDAYRDLDALIVVDVPEVASVDKTPSLLGHVLGETWTQFVTASPRLQAFVNGCEAKKPPKESRKHQVYDACGDVRYMQKTPNGDVTLTCRDSGLKADLSCTDFNGEVVFTGGRLASLKYVEDTTGWKDELADLSAKFGSPSGIDKDNTSALWRTTAYRFGAETTDGGVSLVWETPERYSRTVRDQKALASAEEQ